MAEATITEPKWTINYPNDLTDVDSFAALLAEADQHGDIRGVTMLKDRLATYQRTLSLLHRQFNQIKTSVSFINGVRTKSQKAGDKKRSVRSTAETFYMSLSTPALRQHTAMFSLDYDSFESVEDVVAALVDKHIDMVSPAVAATNGSND